MAGEELIGTTEEKKTFAQWEKEMAEGSLDALAEVAHACLTGRGTEKDQEKGLALLRPYEFEFSCNARVLFVWGMACLAGAGGLSCDLGRGVEYCEYAAAMGHEGARKFIDSLLSMDFFHAPGFSDD